MGMGVVYHRAEKESLASEPIGESANEGSNEASIDTRVREAPIAGVSPDMTSRDDWACRPLRRQP